MASRMKLVDVTKLKQSSGLVTKQSNAVLNQARASLETQQEFMDEGGMDRKKLRSFINSDSWSAQQKHKAREELLRWNEEFKAEIAHDVSVKRKEIRLSTRLLAPKRQNAQTTRRRRTGFI